MKKALLVIDIQNDYFPGGKFPLWNTEAVLENIETAIGIAQAKGVPVILIQHIANAAKGPAPFFNAGTDGVKIHPRILAAAPGAPVVVKEFADGFYKTNLDTVLSGLDVSELLVCGMMTQNCAERYTVAILPECCTTVSDMIHLIALNGVSIRVALVPARDAM
jgi:nicotinamidase-related amidase